MGSDVGSYQPGSYIADITHILSDSIKGTSKGNPEWIATFVKQYGTQQQECMSHGSDQVCDGLTTAFHP